MTGLADDGTSPAPRGRERHAFAGPRTTPAAAETATAADLAYMDRALDLAERARGTTHPNPLVGCVLVRDGTVVGEGRTEPPGGPHAEVVALRAAGAAATGATAYTTLEPCAHTGRTGPCARALIDAGVRRVVIAARDPHPLAGGGLDALRAAGIEVASGVREAVAQEQNAGFLHGLRHGRPLVTVKLALSLDGRIAAADGTSRWLTDEPARTAAHRLRADADAVLVGSGTVLADDPRLTVRLDPEDPAAGRTPLRVVLDRRARTPATAAVYGGGAPSLVVVGAEAAAAHLEDAGCEVVRLPARGGDDGPGPSGDGRRPGSAGDGRGPGSDDHADLEAVLRMLFDRGVRDVMIEGGAGLAGAAVAAGVADRLVAHVAPVLLGDAGRPGLVDLAVGTLADAPRFEITDVARIGPDAVLTCRPRAEPDEEAP